MRYSVLVKFILVPLLAYSQPKPGHNLKFDTLSKRWDEGIPIGNGWLGALIWQKDNKLRMALDRADLWDDRPMPGIDKLKFKWVVEKVKLDQYDSVQRIGDDPYDKYPAPSKIPGAAIEFDLDKIGKVKKVSLDISNGLSIIEFENEVQFKNYIHATRQVGYFAFENTTEDLIPELIIPNYNTGSGKPAKGLGNLGYQEGTVKKGFDYILYHQPTWNDNYYEVFVKWYHFPGKRIIGQWTITNNQPASLPELNKLQKEPTGWPSHVAWWNDYWKRSSVSIPDPVLEKQYYLDMYKFGCVARSNTPPISLQAIWTADDGKLPPWKGGFRHYLSTQLSYWPGYSGNHLDLTDGFTNWLWKVKKENERWTGDYFELPGLNVPGVSTISGKPMGGWIQYSMSPTSSAWLAHHFYLQARYNMNKKFASKALAYIRGVSLFNSKFMDFQRIDTPFIPLSSTPEYNDNSIKAWFKQPTNYDMALRLSLQPQGQKVWEIISGLGGQVTYDLKDGFGDYYINETGLTIAPGQNLEYSHRHHNHLHAIHPLGLLNIEDSAGRIIIENSLNHLEKLGTRKWVGYSFAWIASIYARAQNGDSAVMNLRKFATNFVSPNSFHLNGDQQGGEFSDMTYRNFTLEGNFAFAQGIHEMLLQSHKDFIEVFPAIPAEWKNVSFKTLRTEGAFLISAKKENTVPLEVKIKSEAGGMLRIKLPFKTWINTGIDRSKIKVVNGIAEMKTSKGQSITFKNAFE